MDATAGATIDANAERSPKASSLVGAAACDPQRSPAFRVRRCPRPSLASVPSHADATPNGRRHRWSRRICDSGTSRPCPESTRRGRETWRCSSCRQLSAVVSSFVTAPRSRSDHGPSSTMMLHIPCFSCLRSGLFGKTAMIFRDLFCAAPIAGPDRERASRRPNAVRRRFGVSVHCRGTIVGSERHSGPDSSVARRPSLTVGLSLVRD
jgi:hypothetical protein